MMATGRLMENVVHFVRLLRAAGIPVGPERSVAALEAVQAVGVSNRDDFRAALGTVLLSRQEHRALFDEAFDAFWRNPRLAEKKLASLLPKVSGRAEPEGEQVAPGLADAPAGSAVRPASGTEGGR